MTIEQSAWSITMHRGLVQWWLIAKIPKTFESRTKVLRSLNKQNIIFIGGLEQQNKDMELWKVLNKMHSVERNNSVSCTLCYHSLSLYMQSVNVLKATETSLTLFTISRLSLESKCILWSARLNIDWQGMAEKQGKAKCRKGKSQRGKISN